MTAIPSINHLMEIFMDTRLRQLPIETRRNIIERISYISTIYINLYFNWLSNGVGLNEVFFNLPYVQYRRHNYS